MALVRSSSNEKWLDFNKGTLVAVNFTEERNSVVTNAVENLDQRSGQSGGLATNRSYGSTLLELEQSVEGVCALVERLSRERGSADFDREIKRKDHEIRTERARKKRGREARQLPDVASAVICCTL